MVGETTVWVRRCAACGHDDLRSAFGSASCLDDRPWQCPHCPSARWVAAGVAFPAGPARDRCPFRAGHAESAGGRDR